MSTNKLLQSLSEDPQLEKQIGCMAGILQLFDRHQVLTGRRLYGHKRISATAPKTQTSPSSNCGSPVSESSATSIDNIVRHPSDNLKQKHATAAGIAASPEQQKSQTLPTPSTPTDVKSSSAFARPPSFPVNDTSPHGSSGDQLPKISFDMARSSILTPRRLDSSRSLHEGRVNVSNEGKVFARRSVDTAERAAAAARGALKELSRISTADFTGPSHQADQVSIRDIVRSSFGKEQQVPKSTANLSLSGSSGATHTAFAPRMSNEGSICTPGLARDMSRAQHMEAKSSAECNPAEKTMHSSNAFVSQAAGRVEASRPPRHYKPKSETPTKSCADINESLRLLANLREATPSYNSLLGGNAIADNARNKMQFPSNHVPRPATSSLDVAKEGPVAFASRPPLQRASDRMPGRLSSYEPSRSSSVDVLLQGGPKAREIPRLSLDGRGSGPGFKAADREAGAQGKPQYSRILLNSRSVSCSNSDCDTESLNDKRTSFSSNVVAKLMGLDELPNGEPAEVAELQYKLDPYGSLDQKAPRESNTAVQDTDPTFSQCGKYVSASFFPSKRRDDIKIAMDPEEGEEDSYLQMEPLSHQEARTLSVRVGSSNLQAGHRLATTGSVNNMGHPCYQPKNHHLMEDRPPHVLSPAARLCAQIEEMQLADSWNKDVDRGIRTMEMQQSSQHDLEALKQLLGAIHLNREYSKGAGSRLEKLEIMSTSGKQQPAESGRLSYLHEQYAEQQPPPSAVIWKTKRMLNDELYAHTHDQNPTSRRIPVESRNTKVKNAIQGSDSLLLSRQHASPEIYNQASRTRAEMRSLPAASHPSTYSSPRKTNIGNDCITPVGTTNSNPAITARRLASRTNSPPNFMSPRFSMSPQTPFSHQLRQSYHSSCSWEGSSVSSTSSGHTRDQHLGNSGYRTADKKNKQVERVERKKAGSSILKDKEECKANLVSLKLSPNTTVEKRSNSGVGSRSNDRTARRCMPPQNSDNVRSTMRATKSSARKTEEVKRKLNFVNRSPGRIRPVEMDNEGQDTEFVDKTIVSSINNKSSKNYAHVQQSNENESETGHEEEPFSSGDSHGNQLTNTSSNITTTKTEAVEVKSPRLLLPCVDGETNHNGQQVTASIFSRDPRKHITGDVGSPAATPICTPAGALKLPQLPQQENDDTESQGDKSTGSCEQPSPISVLEGPFYEEDVSSPPTSTKFDLKLEEMEEEARGKDVNGECVIPKSSPQLSECGSPCLNRVFESQDCSAADFDYVKKLLDMTGVMIDTDEKRSNTVMLKLRHLDPHSFLQLEEEILNSASACKSELGSMWKRRLLFDSVNASLERRLWRWRLCQRQPWLLACEIGLHGIMGGGCSPALQQGMMGLDEERNLCLSREGGRVLLEEVWEEIRGMHRKQEGKRKKKMQSVGTGACVGEEEEEEAEDGTCDDVGHLVEEDIFGGPFHTRCPDTWASLHVEKGELGLDLERLIFKDLIDHTIRDLGFLILPTTKRQLFKPHD